MKLTNRTFILWATWIFFAVTQLTILSSLSVSYSEVNLVVVNILLWDYFGADRRVTWVGVVLAGLTLDLFSPLFFGAITILLCIIAGLSYYLQSRLAQYLTYAILLGGCFLAVVIYDVGGMLLAGMTLRVPWWTVALDGALTTGFAMLELISVTIVKRTILHPDRNLLDVRRI